MANEPARTRNRVGLIIGILLVLFVGVPIAVDVYRGSQDSEDTGALAVPIPPLVRSVDDACNQFWNLMLTAIEERQSDDIAAPRFTALGRAVGRHDVALAAAIEAMGDPESPSDVSANAQVAFRRCSALGFVPTADQSARLDRAGSQPIPRL